MIQFTPACNTTRWKVKTPLLPLLPNIQACASKCSTVSSRLLHAFYTVAEMMLMTDHWRRVPVSRCAGSRSSPMR